MGATTTAPGVSMSRTTTPSETHRVALVGLGWFGRIHAETWATIAGVELIGYFDTQSAPEASSRQDAFHTGRPSPAGGSTTLHRFATLEELLQSDADLVDVVTPEDLHADIVRKVLLADKNVVVEKPLALNALAVRDLRELAARRGKQIYVGHVLRFDLRHITAHATMASDELRHLSFQRHFQRVAHDVYGRVHPVHGAAIHDIDLAVWFVNRRPESVQAFASHYLKAPHPDVLDIIIDWAMGSEPSFRTRGTCPRTHSGSTSSAKYRATLPPSQSETNQTCGSGGHRSKPLTSISGRQLAERAQAQSDVNSSTSRIRAGEAFQAMPCRLTRWSWWPRSRMPSCVHSPRPRA